MITGKLIPLDARLMLIDIMMAAGVQACEITSVARTPLEQAEAMYENCIGTGPKQGPEEELHLYLAAGDAVIDVFVANQDKPRDQIIELMRQKIVEVGPQNVSHHCVSPLVLTVFDIGPASVLPRTALPAFEAALTAAVTDGRLSKFLSPRNSDPALHVERPVAALPS